MNDLLPDVSPKAGGPSTEPFARIDRFLQGFISRQELAGIVTLVAHRGRVVHSAQFGFRDEVEKRPMTSNAIFRIASMTKPVTSVAAMILLERGHFKLTDPISAYIPEFKDMLVYGEGKSGQIGWEKLTTEITFHHLLTHTSGLGYPESYNRAVGAIYETAEPNASRSLTELTNKLARLPLFVQSGSQWHYGYSHDVLARLVEIISGRDFGQFLEEEIFRPLGMIDTAHYVPEEKVNRLACLYQKDERSGFREVDIICPHSPPGLKPGGHGLFSTAKDFFAIGPNVVEWRRIEWHSTSQPGKC